MKKIILSVAALSTALAQAQVGINEEMPKATLDISVKKDNIDNESQEGLLIPRVTKEKALKMANNTTTPPVESALIYVNDTNLTSPSDTTVEDITEKGYYFWNGAKWVKSSGIDGNGLWYKRDNNDIVLKNSDASPDNVFYRKGGGYEEVVKPEKRVSSDTYFDTGSGTYQPVTNIPEETRPFSYRKIEQQSHNLVPPSSFNGEQKNYNVLGFTVDKNDTFEGKSFYINTVGSKIDTENNKSYGTVLLNRNYLKHEGTGTIDYLRNQYNTVSIAPNSTIGQSAEIIYNALENFSSNPSINNILSINRFMPKGTGTINWVTLNRNWADLSYASSSDIDVLRISEDRVEVNNDYNGTIDKLFGYSQVFKNSGSTRPNVNKMYGLYLSSVNWGKEENYAIYSNVGKLRFGDLAEAGAGDRIVMADENGVLKTSTTASLSDFTEPNGENRRAFKYSSSLGNTFEIGAGVRSYIKASTVNEFGHHQLLDVDNEATGSQYRNLMYTKILEDNTKDYERITGEKIESFQNGSGTLQEILGSHVDARITNGRVQHRMIAGAIKANHSANSNTQEVTAVDAEVTYRGDNKTISRSYGVRSRVTIATNGVTGGNYSNWYGVQSGFYIPETFAGNVTNAYGFHYYFDESRDVFTSSKVDNLYGVYLSDIKGASNSNYAIYTNKGINRFGDDIKLSISENDTYSSTIGRTLSTGAGLAFKVNSKVDVATLPINFIDFDFNNSVDNTQRGIVRFFRGTNLEGTKSVEVYKGNQSTDVVAKLAVGGNSFVVNEQGFNFGVGTINPTEKLEVAGSIKSTALAGVGNRVVLADQDGKLVVGANTSSMGLWANNTSAGLVELKATSNGTPRVNSGVRNDVTIDDSGKITAKGFIGYNGATIFPDYVFEKYYTGESTIKADYNFHNLASVESFIKTNGHLPGYQSAKEIASKGLIDLGATQLTNVEKIEELYLHLIEKDKEVQELKSEMQSQKAELDELKKLVKQLTK